jgi:hypothetical protein
MACLLSSEEIVELRAESIGMHDSGGFVCGDCNEFEEVACGVGADHEESLLAVVLVLDVPEAFAQA